MRATARPGLLALFTVACALAPQGWARAQVPAAGKAAGAPAPAPAPAKTQTKAQTASPAVRPAILNQVLATANGEAITRGELINFLSNYQIPPGEEATAYKDAVETLINTHLINQFLVRQRIPVPEEKVAQAIDTLKKQLTQDGKDLATEILRTGMSMDDVKKEYATRIRWVEYVNARATDAELKKFAATHKDLFGGTQVKASHILLKVDPKAAPADKEKARQKLVALQDEIKAGKTTFAAAANKFSADPANSEGAGGDVGYFTLSSGFIEEFATAAFALKKGEVSDPVETPYGLHLILATDRKEGNPFDFEQNKPFVKQMYSAELQKQLLQSQRKVAKIEIKPMPSDLFPPTPTPAAAPASAPAAKKAASPETVK